MAEKNEIDWIFDAIVGFLQGSFWSSSILNFIEEKSLIFEPETLDSKEYREIHQEYKNFVNLLLDCYMEDMAIVPEQFEQACSLIKTTGVSVKFDQGLFEQIWAANEYEVFKRMMIQKNLELQLQSLKLIEEKFGLTPASLTHETNDLFGGEPKKTELLNMKTHIAEVEKLQLNANVDMKKDDIVSELKDVSCEAKLNPDIIQKALIKSTETLLPSTNINHNHETKVDVEKMPVESSNHKQCKENDAQIPGTSSITSSTTTNFHEEFIFKSMEETTEEDIRNRQLYLKAQRDKLVALKQRARNQKLKVNAIRPNSARVVAEATIDGKQEDLVAHQQVMDASILQIRKALAARLKAEVVQK